MFSEVDIIFAAGGRSAQLNPEGTSMSVSQLIDAYVAAPQALRGAVAGMSREQLVSRPVSGRWSTLEVVCHLVDSDQAWIHRMKRVIAEDRPLHIGYDEKRFAAALGYQERDLEEELTLFELMRRQLGRVLRGLPASAWNRDGVHNESGLLTLEQHLQVEVDHVPHHLKFVAEKRKALGLAPKGA
jgi:uncharacterized damage-inducible protein DinB